MLIASILFCYIPYRRLAVIKKKLEDISDTHIYYMDLLKYLFNLTNCKQISWSTWNQCTTEQLNRRRQRELPFANCQLVYENMSCDCHLELIEDIQQIDENSYIHYGCIPDFNQQLIILPVNATIVNVTTTSNLSGIILKPCITRTTNQNIVKAQ
uniref:Bm9306 n=1 Tax=Brugia malayi TaxID=6279 RepID=A0A1I9G6L5_BRUMA|nr:Bm9306 [Brugia malayi]